MVERSEGIIGARRTGWRGLLVTLVAAVALTGSIIAFAEDAVPNMKGKWVGKTYTIIAGRGGHWPTSAGTWEKPGLYQKDLTFDITGQEDRRFWGITIISGMGQKTQEPFIGELTGAGNRHAILVDTDGYWGGDISGDVFSFCYAQAEAMHEDKTSSAVVSCTEVRHEH